MSILSGVSEAVMEKVYREELEIRQTWSFQHRRYVLIKRKVRKQKTTWYWAIEEGTRVSPIYYSEEQATWSFGEWWQVVEKKDD